MASDIGLRAPGIGLALFVAGGGAVLAWDQGFWGTVAGVALVAVWLLVLLWRSAMASASALSPPDAPGEDEPLPLHALLDQIPIALAAIEAGTAHALNRAARALFATDDRILPMPTALADETASHLFHEGRRYRIDRIEAGAVAMRRTIVTLVDIEAEERAAQARAAADMIQVLGHETLNGLAPIVSLAESGLALLSSTVPREPRLVEILGTLARRAESLLHFTEAYRRLARLPDPARAPVDLGTLGEDLARLFASHWGNEVTLEVCIDTDSHASIDRDQITQAAWALLQNAAEAAIRGSKTPMVGLTMRLIGNRAAIDVLDSGNGVDPSDLDRIFRPFHTTKEAGSGIGLSLVRQIAHAHGGDVRLASNEPTTFELRIGAS